MTTKQYQTEKQQVISSAVPAGWKLVPVEPTQEMLDSPPNAWPADAKVTWDAMLATLPTPPADCTRSHPHEDMSDYCLLRTEIARLTNENARLKASQPVVRDHLLPS